MSKDEVFWDIIKDLDHVITYTAINNNDLVFAKALRYIMMRGGYRE